MAIGPELTEYGVNLFQFYSLITSGLLELSSMGKICHFSWVLVALGFSSRGRSNENDQRAEQMV